MNPREHPGWPAFRTLTGKISDDSLDLTGIAGLVWSYFIAGWVAKSDHDSPRAVDARNREAGQDAMQAYADAAGEPDPNAPIQKAAATEIDAGPSGTPRMSLDDEAKELHLAYRRLLDLRIPLL